MNDRNQFSLFKTGTFFEKALKLNRIGRHKLGVSLWHAFICTICLFAYADCYSQTNSPTHPSLRQENVKIASPNAASLGKPVDIPISYYSGIPNIDIPIYTVQEGPLQLPISLGYHAGGLKVMEQASWVGAGFSLNAGGMITRSVRGLPDEQIMPEGVGGSNISYLSSNGYYNYLCLSQTDVSGYSFLPQDLPQYTGLDWAAFAQGLKDGEADLFTFNFNGYSGKFYFRPDNTATLVPQQDIKITPLFCAGVGCSTTNEKLYGWIATTPDGVKYYFGKTMNNTGDTDPIEYTHTYSYSGGLTFSKAISSWFLYRIESPDSKFHIDIKYTPENYSYYSMSLFPQPGLSSYSEGVDLVKNFMYGVRLDAIEFSNGSVKFIPTDEARTDLSSDTGGLVDTDPVNPLDDKNAKALKEIKISNGTSFDKSFTFNYGYFNDESHPLSGVLGTANMNGALSIHSDKQRLKLNTLTEKSGDGTLAKPPHIFTYFDDAFVPRTLSFAQDHWGYFNGATTNQSMVPTLSIDGGYTRLYGNGANREAAWPAMRAGALQKIQYPTGGYSQFVFNHHEVFVPTQRLDSIPLGRQTAYGTGWGSGNSLPGITFSLDETTQMRATVDFPAGYGPNGPVHGSGALHIINTDTNHEEYQLGAQGSDIFPLPPGNYKYYVQNTSNNNSISLPIVATLTKFVPTRMQFFPVIVGGLRIESVISSDGTSAVPIKKEYSYVDNNGTNQGVLFSRPNYISIVRNDMLKAAGGLPPSFLIASDGFIRFNTNIRAYYTSPSSVHPMRTSQGGHFGYNQVKEILADGSYTIYKFKLSGNPPGDVSIRIVDVSVSDPDVPNYPPTPAPFKFDRGELISKAIYNTAGNLLKEIKTTTAYTYEQVGVRGIIATRFNDYRIASEYEMFSAKKSQVTEEEFVYDSSDPSLAPGYKKTDTYFSSLWHTQPTKITVSNASGEVVDEIRKTYVDDLVIPSCYTSCVCGPDQWLVSALDSNQTNFNAALAGCAVGDNACQYREWNRYQYYLNESRKTYVNLKLSWNSSFNACMTGNGAWSLVTASPDLQAIVQLRNQNQTSQILESSLWRNGQFLEGSMLKYKDFKELASDPISIFPSEYKSIKPQTPQPSNYFSPISLTNTEVVTDTKYGSEDTYEYRNGQLVQTISKSGVPTSYIWGYNNNLPIVKATGILFSTLSSAYTAVSGNLSLIRSQPSLSAGQISTYLYDPLFGMTSQTDANGFTTTFNYDKLGRLVNILDKDGNLVRAYSYHYKGN